MAREDFYQAAEAGRISDVSASVDVIKALDGSDDEKKAWDNLVNKSDKFAQELLSLGVEPR